MVKLFGLVCILLGLGTMGSGGWGSVVLFICGLVMLATKSKSRTGSTSYTYTQPVQQYHSTLTNKYYSSYSEMKRAEDDYIEACRRAGF